MYALRVFPNISHENIWVLSLIQLTLTDPEGPDLTVGQMALSKQI